MGESLSLDPLLQLGLGHWRAKPFLTVCELRLFTLIEAGTNTVEAVAGALSLPERGTRFLLDGMVALQLLAKESGGYQTTPLSSTFLVEGKPGYMGDFFVAVNRLYFAPFGDFELALREDRPVWSVDAQGKHVTLTGEAADLSTRAMHALNTPTGLAFGQMYNLAGRRHLLDLGGGSGAMSIGAVSHNPGLMATVLDRSGVCAVARSYIAEAGLAQRIDTLAAEFIRRCLSCGPRCTFIQQCLPRLPTPRVSDPCCIRAMRPCRLPGRWSLPTSFWMRAEQRQPLGRSLISWPW